MERNKDYRRIFDEQTDRFHEGFKVITISKIIKIQQFSMTSHTPKICMNYIILINTYNFRYLFSCCGSVVKMFSVTTGEQMRFLKGHTDKVVGVAINPMNQFQVRLPRRKSSPKFILRKIVQG